MWFGGDEIIEGCYFHATFRYKQFSLRKTFHQKPNPLVKRWSTNLFHRLLFLPFSFSSFLFVSLFGLFSSHVLHPALKTKELGLFNFPHSLIGKYLSILRLNVEITSRYSHRMMRNTRSFQKLYIGNYEKNLLYIIMLYIMAVIFKRDHFIGWMKNEWNLPNQNTYM